MNQPLPTDKEHEEDESISIVEMVILRLLRFFWEFPWLFKGLAVVSTVLSIYVLATGHIQHPYALAILAVAGVTLAYTAFAYVVTLYYAFMR